MRIVSGGLLLKRVSWVGSCDSFQAVHRTRMFDVVVVVVVAST